MYRQSKSRKNDATQSSSANAKRCKMCFDSGSRMRVDAVYSAIAFGLAEDVHADILVASHVDMNLHSTISN